ncbi:hypothetical protein BY996DRAFT_6414369 [Phakopsora pachyrhizi]|nr:hypothetical protein BY996DRAFT_6414369 [Phakopsora pachyrhizi]
MNMDIVDESSDLTELDSEVEKEIHVPFMEMGSEELCQWNQLSEMLFKERNFSATALHNNLPEAFASALTFTTSEFQNTPNCDCDSSYVACGWWMQVDKETELFENHKNNSPLKYK